MSLADRLCAFARLRVSPDDAHMTQPPLDAAVATPLGGIRVLVTRPADHARSLMDAIAQAGGVPLGYPTIAIAPPLSWAPFDEAARRFEVPAGAPAPYDWVIFTSPSAVRAALVRSGALGAGLRSGRAAVAAVGAGTGKALEVEGIRVALLPEDQRQEGLAAAFRDGPPNPRILFPQAAGGRTLLVEHLRAQGASVEVVPVSRTVALSLAEPPPAFDLAIFASPSAFIAFVGARSRESLDGKVIVAIGPTTAAAVRQAGLVVDIVATAPSVADLVGSISAWRRPVLP
jgi:uroporphyrinogen-III synthase